MTTFKLTALALGLVAVGSLAGCAKPEAAKTGGSDSGKVAEAVKADMANLVNEFNAKDVEKAVRHDANNFVGMFHGMPNVNGPAEDLAVTKQQALDPVAKVVTSGEAVDVASSGDMAVYHATYTYTFSDPKTKKPTTENGNWVTGYRLQGDGTWKMTFSVISDVPAPTTKALQAG